MSWRYLLRYLRPYLLPLGAGLVCALMVSAGNLMLPYVFGKGFVDQVLLRATAGSSGTPALLNWLALGVLLLTVVKGVFTYGRNYLLGYVAQRFAMDLRNAIFDRLQGMSLRYHEQEHSGEAIVRVTSDATLLQNVIGTTLGSMAADGLMVTGILVFTFVIHWQLAVLSLLFLPLVGVCISRFGDRVRVFTRQMQERIAGVTQILQETLSGIRIIKAFSLEDQRQRRFQDENQQSFWAGLRSLRVQATVSPLVELLLVALMTGLIWYGARAVVMGQLSAGDLVAFLTYTGMASAPMAALSQHYTLLRQAEAASDRIVRLLQAETEHKDAPGAVTIERVRGEVCFEHVNFAYEPGHPVLEDINLTLRPGQVVALIGPSGAGKTTLAHLLLRFYDPAGGRITIDGLDLRHITLSSLRRQIGLVPQETVLFGVSVRENIAYGRPDATLAEIEAAARAAYADEFIRQLPQGYDTILAEQGGTLSGGQRQRLAIARALLRDPRILILDEATSALDARSEALVQQALQRLMKGRTTLVIAHRLSTVRQADWVAVLDHGRIVEQGTPAELLARPDSLFGRLYRLQTQIPGEAVAAVAATALGTEATA
ncbi:MAG: ABC transporter ATP-binding protein [Limnochordaceae bacterium]|nr:ABC transporter ATP-binding protein [Limnochordaceae bacterium]